MSMVSDEVERLVKENLITEYDFSYNVDGTMDVKLKLIGPFSNMTAKVDVSSCCSYEDVQKAYYDAAETYISKAQKGPQPQPIKNTLFKVSDNIIKTVFVDQEKKVIVVQFSDDTKEVIKCSLDDDFDPAVGVSLAICRKLFGHATFYKKIVQKKAHYIKAKK